MQDSANCVSQYASTIAAFLSFIATACAAYTAYIAPLSAAKMAEKLRRDGVSRERKLDCLRRIAGYRSVPTTPEWVAALNEVFVTFNDSPDVLSCFTKYDRTIQRTHQQDVSELVDLIKAMLSDLGLSKDKIDDQTILSPIAIGRLI